MVRVWLQETEKFPSVPLGVCGRQVNWVQCGLGGGSQGHGNPKDQKLSHFNALQHLDEGWQGLKRKHAD